MKKETLEEAAENHQKNTIGIALPKHTFIEGAKWQQQNSYSEEIINILDNVWYWETCPDDYKVIIESFIEQFKKKSYE